jgi:hypothetical protein
MQGTIVKQTEKSVYMHLHGVAKATVKCMRCGRELTNPVSRAYGLGVECLGKVGILVDLNDIDTIREHLIHVEWTGWIPKSSILSDEIVDVE